MARAILPNAGEEVITSIGNPRGGKHAAHAADAPSLLPNAAGAGDISASDSDEDEVQKVFQTIKGSHEYTKRVGGPTASRVATAPVAREPQIPMVLSW